MGIKYFATIVTLSTLLTVSSQARADYVKNHNHISQVKTFKCNDLPIVEGEEHRLLKCVVAPVGSSQFNKYPYELIIDIVEESSQISVAYNNTNYLDKQFHEGVETVGTASYPKNIKPTLKTLFNKTAFSAEFRQGLARNKNQLNAPHALIVKKYFEAIKIKNKIHTVESRDVYLVYRLSKENSCYLGFVNELATARNLADNLAVGCN